MVHVLLATLHVKNDSDVEKVRDELIKAAKIYARDKETLSWRTIQNTSNPKKFVIVERYEREASLKFHRENPHYPKFKEIVGPLLDGGVQVEQFTELDTRDGGDHYAAHSDPSVADIGDA